MSVMNVERNVNSLDSEIRVVLVLSVCVCVCVIKRLMKVNKSVA